MSQPLLPISYIAGPFGSSTQLLVPKRIISLQLRLDIRMPSVALGPDSPGLVLAVYSITTSIRHLTGAPWSLMNIATPRNLQHRIDTPVYAVGQEPASKAMSNPS